MHIMHVMNIRWHTYWHTDFKKIYLSDSAFSRLIDTACNAISTGLLANLSLNDKMHTLLPKIIVRYMRCVHFAFN